MNKKRKDLENQFYNDIYGIILIVTGIFLLASIYTDKTGFLGKNLVTILSWAFGWGRFIIPYGLIGCGIASLLRYQIDLKRSGIGLTLSYISILSLIHVSVPPNKMFLKGFLFKKGGIFGSLISYPLVWLVKPFGAYLLLSGALLIGVVLTTGLPLSHLVLSFLEALKLVPLKKKPSYKRDEEKIFREVERETVFLEEPEAINELPTSEKSKKTIQLPLQEEIQEEYRLPPLNLLNVSKGKVRRSIKEMQIVLEKVLKEFNVRAHIAGIKEGPTVTRFEIQLEPGVKVNRLISITDDISLALASPDIRILTPIPGKSVIGIEVPNIYRELVTLGDILISEEAKKFKSILTFALGKDTTGQPTLADLKEMPHLLIAGATGSGKSVCLNSLIMSILFRATPKEVKMILIDPKRIELNLFNSLPHLIIPVVTNPRQSAAALTWAVGEMERRFEKLAETETRNIDAYNLRVGKDEPMPYLIIVIDELADLMMVSPVEVEEAICRIAQLARAVGIHLVVATQRPSSDIITGLIKANITSRIAFAVSSQVDSRVILDTPGAEKLVGKGDMLFVTPSYLKPKRIQGAFVTESEIERVTNFIKSQSRPHYNLEILEIEKTKFGEGEFFDELLDDAIELVVNTGIASVSFFQRKLKIGYARAARIMDILEERGIVSPPEGAKPRTVLLTKEEWEKIKEK